MSKKGKIQLNKRLLAISAVSLVVLLMTSVTAYAWFTSRRKLDTITKVSSPSTLVIGAGNKEAAVNIDLGRIDAEDTGKKKDIVFCVYSDESVQEYKIQLAHTTNINFTYAIYNANISTKDSFDAEYTDADNNSHYYIKSSNTPLAGAYLNRSDTERAANDQLHDRSYNAEDIVQKNAEPLYWQTTDNITPTNNNGSGFADYYILEVSWGEDVKNDKETDMVYITVGKV